MSAQDSTLLCLVMVIFWALGLVAGLVIGAHPRVTRTIRRWLGITGWRAL